MKERKEVIEYCKTFEYAYEDYPFGDTNWTVMRRSDTKRGFAWVFSRENNIWINLKADPSWADIVKNTYSSIIPAYHMNKKHWISVILDGSVPQDEIEALINDSYILCGK